MKTNKQLCEEYNKLTGGKITRFSSIWRGEERLALAKKANAKLAKSKVIKANPTTPFRVRVGGATFRSVRQAFIKLALPGDYREVLNKLRNQKTTTYYDRKFRRV